MVLLVFFHSFLELHILIGIFLKQVHVHALTLFQLVLVSIAVQASCGKIQIGSSEKFSAQIIPANGKCSEFCAVSIDFASVGYVKAKGAVLDDVLCKSDSCCARTGVSLIGVLEK